MVKRVIEPETPSWCSLMMIISDSPLMPSMAMAHHLEAWPSVVFMKRAMFVDVVIEPSDRNCSRRLVNEP